MKVLWFTNTPSGASEKIHPTLYIGGWLSSVEEQLVKNKHIEMSVCFYWNREIEPFRYKQTMYYPIYRNGEHSHLGRFINRVTHRNKDSADLEKLVAVINLVSPDLIHVHGTEKNYGLVQRLTDIPVVVSVQGILLPYTCKFFSGISYSKAFFREGILPKIAFTSISIVYLEFKQRAKREEEIFAMSKHILGRTNWDKRVTRLLAPNSDYYVFEDMLRPIFYNCLWAKTKFGTPIHIVSVLTEGIYKGLETIVEAVRILRSHNFPVKWTIVGLSFKSPMVRIIQNSMLGKFSDLNILIVGPKSDVELVEIMTDADIYCHPSHIENSPNSLCEAMLLGMPVIATLAGGTDTLFKQGKQGLLIQDGDPYSMAGAIKELASDYDLASEYGATARKHALIKHDPDRITSSLIDVYTLVANKPKVSN